MLDIRVLGPFEVLTDGVAVEVPPGRLRAMLARLAIAAGEIVSVERLADATWGGDLPENVRRAVQLYISRLRVLLGGKDLIQVGPGGYVLRVAAAQVDALRFAGLLSAAAAGFGGPREEGLLREALALWRGRPFAGVGSPWLEESAAPPLVEQYLAAVERRVDLDVSGGHAIDVIAELAGLTAEHPLREALWARLLAVLAACGRQAEALERYERIRSRLADELGTDPGPELKAVYADLLGGRVPSLAGRNLARRVPRQLPADITGFTGRQPTLRELAACLSDGYGTARGPVIAALVGTAGIGKSALAIHAAHGFAGDYPDGQLYVDLQGATPGLRPLSPLEVLGRFLRALGIHPSDVPDNEAEASARFRSEVAAKRLLVVLDNAADAGQVAPLLPGLGCAVLVTSRNALPTLPGARHLHVDVLTPAEATDLLRLVAGPARVAAEPTAAAGIARLCGWLPLALRVAAARLAVRPGWPLQAMLERLTNANRLLSELEAGDIGVRASFMVSLEQLRASGDPVERRACDAFAMLGILDGPDCAKAAAARLLGLGEPEAEQALERLVDANLLASSVPGRYRLHDLLRLLAREIARRDHPAQQRAAALTRALGFYTSCAWRTLEVLRPGDNRIACAKPRWRERGREFADSAAALGWLEAERANLLAAVEQAGATPGVPGEIAIQLTQALFGFLHVRGYGQNLIQVNQTAIRIARQARDRAAEAQAHYDLGSAYWRQGLSDQALACVREGLAVHLELGDRHGEASGLGKMGVIYEYQEEYDLAVACLEKGLAIHREVGNRGGEADALLNLASVYERQGRYERALSRQQQSLALFRKMGDRLGEAAGLDNLGVIFLRQGRHDEALSCLRESLELNRELGDRPGQANALADLGITYLQQSQFAEALACLRDSLELNRELGQPRGQAETLRQLGVALQALGRPEEARQHFLDALAIFDRLQSTDADHVRTLLRSLSASACPAGASPEGD